MSISTIIESGISSGRAFRDRQPNSIEGLLLLFSSAGIGVLGSFLGGTIYSILLGLNIYLEYNDMTGYIRKQSNEDGYYVFGWLPLVLVLVLYDILILSDIIGEWPVAIFAMFLTTLGFLVGYLRIK